MSRVLVTLAALAAAVTLTASVGAAPLIRAAPGRELIGVTGGVTVRGMGEAGAVGAAALPGGDVIAVGGPQVQTAGEGFYLADITHDGTLNPAFGILGVAHVDVANPLKATQVLRRPDGRLLVIMDGDGASAPAAAVYGLEPDGTVDQSWGIGGVATLDLTTASGVVDAAGDLVLSGIAGAGTQQQFRVERLGASGQPDHTFGTNGTTIVATTTPGVLVRQVVAVGLSRDGAILAIGPNQSVVGSQLVRLRPDGTIEPAFQPAGVLATTLVVEADGSSAVGGAGDVTRFGPDGTPVVVYGQGDPSAVASTVALLGNPDGSLLVVRAMDGFPGGELTPWAIRGNIAHVLPRIHALDPGGQDARMTAVVRRADGSYLAVGEVSRVVSGDGGISEDGTTAFDFAAVALTPAFALDPTFGGPAKPISAHLHITTSTAKQAHHDHAIFVQASVPTWVQSFIRVKAHGRLVAQIVTPMSAGSVNGPTRLTPYGRTLFATHHHVAITATLTIEDALRRTASATAHATLR